MERGIKNVWVVDDDASSNLLTSKMLINTNLVKNVWTDTSASRAFERMKQRIETGEDLPEMIFLDLRMPDMDGWQFLDAIKEHEELDPKPEIILLTGSTRTNDLIKSVVTPHIGSLINKPLTDFELRQVLTNYLEGQMCAG